MNTETKVTIHYLETKPLRLKEYLIKKYGRYIDQIKSNLKSHFNEDVDVHYTFMEHQWALDLDFYLVHNKANYPIAYAAKRKLPVVFVIMPAGNQKAGSDKRLFEEEGIYFKNKNKSMKWIYKNKNVKDINWERLFKKAVQVRI